MASSGDPTGATRSHSLAAAERDRPIRERLLAIAAREAQPVLRDTLVALTAAQAQASLAEEIAAVVQVLDHGTVPALDTRVPHHDPADQASLADHLSQLGALRAGLVAHIAHGSAPDNGRALGELSRRLAGEFASVFWSGMLTRLRRAAAAGTAGSRVLVDALHVDRASDAWPGQATLVEAAADFGLDSRQFERCGARILQAVLDDDDMARRDGDTSLLRLPMGLDVDRAELDAALQEVHRRHQFDRMPVVSLDEIAAADSLRDA